ncbi:Ig-like domain-containing protein [Piscinibacter sp.]|uniref:Ig-like domain-containing protein n=1 Tax=Piscinibacter sp. TaxID=1903157 RepID=UPI0039E6F331
MKLVKAIWILLCAATLAACGGGGGGSGGSPFGNGSGTGGGGGGGGGSGSGSSGISVSVTRAGVATSQITSTETVQATAVVRDSSGSVVPGIVVKFTEDGTSLLKFAPSSGTALTDALGVATVDITSSDAANTGALAVKASAALGSSTLSGSKAIEITAGSGGGIAATPAAISFVGATPSGTAIVVKGAGGSGRSESAILTFKVVDVSNTPVNGTTVNFTINAASGGATISPTSAQTNANGQVTVTVSSGTQPASVVVTAVSVAVPSVKTQSDTLIVSNDIVLPEGFEIVAEKYNLDGNLTGDKTKVTAYVRDQFGNPVADGVAVNFRTDYGVVASSTLGGCTTTNGTCSVDFKVQEPRGTTGIATVVGSVRIGDTQVVSDSIQINMAQGPYFAVDEMGTPISQVQLNGSCKQVLEMYLSDANAHSVAAGTTIAAPSASAGVNVTVKTGSPVLDQLTGGFPPTLFSIQIDLSGSDVAPACNAGAGTGTATTQPTFFRLEFKTPNNIVYSQRVLVLYPH